MKQEKASVKIMQDYRRIKEKNKYPLKLQISWLGLRKYYSTGYDATKDEWGLINSQFAKARLRTIKNALTILENKAIRCIDDLPKFTFHLFEEEFFEGKTKFENVETAYKMVIEELRANDQYGTAAGYQTAMRMLMKYKKKILFEDVTKEFLQDFERWMLANDKSLTTVGIYLKTLRAIMNLAKSTGIVTEKEYPFGRRKYIIPAGRNIKRALDAEHTEQIFNYHTDHLSVKDKAKDFWIFSYLCNGINNMDTAHLRWSNIQQDKIVFERSKTKRTKRDNPVKIIALRNLHIDRIIKKWGTKPIATKDVFVFDILDIADNPKRARDKVQLFTHVMNDWLKEIGKDLNLPIKLTTYTARHSFATMLVRGGAPLAFASQTLGHSNILTTQRYFAGFDLKAHAEYTKSLTNFKINQLPELQESNEIF